VIETEWLMVLAENFFKKDVDNQTKIYHSHSVSGKHRTTK